jgi:endoglucanase
MGPALRCRFSRITGTLALFCFCLLVGISNFAFAQSAPLSSVPPQRLENLRRGINLSGWFAQVGNPSGYTKEHLETTITADDLALIKSMGFDNVRLSVDPTPLYSESRPNVLNAEYLGYLDAAVKMILDHGLAVTIDIHPESSFKASLNDDTNAQRFADFWRALAKHYSSWDPDRIFFEIMNEPEMGDRYRWYGIETKVAQAIREGAPLNTIIVAGARWSDDDDLVFLVPLRDPNVIYNFHYYEPHIFTHQGATWGSPYWRWLTDGLHYPSSPDSAQKLAAEIPDPVDRLNVIRYGYDHWDAARIDGDMSQVADWAALNHVHVICNEFGVFRAFAPPQDRAAWIHDVRTSLESHGMGWAMWDYDGGFGVVNRVNGKRVPDELTVKALGLRGSM